MKKPRLTMQQHVQVGKDLREIHAKLLSVGITVSNAYPLRHDAVRLSERARKNLSELRSELEEAMFLEHPSASTKVYYPGVA